MQAALPQQDVPPSRPAEESGLPDSGPFPAALRAAINASGLSLDRIQHRLQARGVRVSVATLSYWQSGRRRPERPESLQALAELEAVLQVAPSALSSLLGPPRPRGRRGRTMQLPPLHSMWTPQVHAAELLRAVDARDDSMLSRLSQYDNCTVDANRRLASMRSRQVLRAEAEGMDRWVLVYDWEGTPSAVPVLSGLRNCRLGRVVTHPGASLLVAELVFERALNRGETLIIDYEVHNDGGEVGIAGDSHSRKFRLPVREYVLEVRFDPAELPARCVQFTNPTAPQPSTPRPTGAQPPAPQSSTSQPSTSQPSAAKHLPLSGSGETHAVGLDLPPGEFGIRWEWPT